MPREKVRILPMSLNPAGIGSRSACVEQLESRRLLSGTWSLLSAELMGMRPASAGATESSAAVHAAAHSRSHAAHVITWTPIAPSPIPRFESAAEVVRGKLFIFGGFIDAQVHATSRSDVFDPHKNTWTQIADMPEPLTHTGHVVVGHNIWFAGGFVGDEGNVISPSTADVWVYDTKKNIWFPGPALPEQRGAGAM